MARVREETLMHGTRQGTIRSLAVTGAVITSFVKVLGANGAAVAGMRLYEAHISPDS